MASGKDRILEMARGFQSSRILLTAVELGIFATLGDDEKTSGAVAANIGADKRATDRLMNALVALGLLDKQNNKFHNAADAQNHLVPGKPGYAGGALGHMISLWNTWSTLTDAVIAGHSTLSRESRGDWAAPFIAAMHYNAGIMANEVIPLIDLTGVKRVLDVGGGSGGYSIAFCKAKHDIEAVVFDLSDVVPLTKSYIKEAGLSDRITTTIGDFNIDELPGGFDMVFMSQILHSNSSAENAELIKKAYHSLNPCGTLVVQEFIIDEDRTSPSHVAFFSLNMLVGTKEGDTYTETELRKWFTDAGIGAPKRIDTKGGTTLLVAPRR
jgi:SAM-dependent methyltransferase